MKRPSIGLVRAGALGVVAVVAGLVVFGGCGSDSTPSAPAAVPGTASADAGDLHLRGAYVPAQTSPEEAAAYFRLTNDGDRPDTLTRVTSDVSSDVSLHDTVSKGGAESMVPIGTITVPAHGTVDLSVGHRHLMIMNPSRQLKQGESVRLTLTFSGGGPLTVTAPVVAATGPQ